MFLDNQIGYGKELFVAIYLYFLAFIQRKFHTIS